MNVDGNVTTGDAKVPGRTEGKSGSINTSFVTIDGIEYMPQTTMNWKITIPGQLVDNIDGSLVLNDTFTSGPRFRPLTKCVRQVTPPVVSQNDCA